MKKSEGDDVLMMLIQPERKIEIEKENENLLKIGLSFKRTRLH